jgi:hypothetical protein
LELPRAGTWLGDSTRGIVDGLGSEDPKQRIVAVASPASGDTFLAGRLALVTFNFPYSITKGERNPCKPLAKPAV